MKRHVLTIHYDGLLAAQHAMDAADSHTVTEGAKRLLAAFAYYWTAEELPDRLYTETDHFHVLHTALRPGSCEYEFVVNILASGAWDVARWTFEALVITSFLAWRERRESDAPEYARREPIFDVWGPSNRPIFDFGAARDLQRQRLNDRITQSMHQITIPLGRHATSAELIFEGKSLGTWTRRVPR
jgi:hypothetical protein